MVGLSVTFVFMFVVSLLCAFGFQWAPLLWLPACAVFFPLWIVLQIVSGRQGDAPEAALDEYEVQQRNSARSIALSVTQNLMLIPSFYLIFGAVITGGTDVDMAYAGGLMSLTVLSIGACTPAMILGWSRPGSAHGLASATRIAALRHGSGRSTRSARLRPIDRAPRGSG